MERPGWSTFVGILMLLVGGCGALDNIEEMEVDNYREIQNQISIEIEEDLKQDSISTEELNEKIDSSDQKFLEFMGDSIVRDSNQNIDLAKTVESMMAMSDYRIKWVMTFAYIGLFISILYFISGVMFLSSKKWVIQIALLTLSLSLIVEIFQFIIFRADSGTSTMISKFANMEIYLGMFIDMALLIVIMVLDKSYYNDAYYKEDYYDVTD